MDIRATYESLPCQRSIRILSIQPGEPTEDIACSLEVVNLDDQPQYKALSYTWGDPSTTKSIQCNGNACFVTENLFGALVKFRDREQKIGFWIDQLCINQDDLAERAQQVLLMGEVYAKAGQVWVWLGVEAENSSLAMSFLKKLAALLPQTPQRSLTTAEISEYGLSWQRAAAELDALAALYCRQWFGRLWIIQEVVLAIEVWIACGNETILWQELADATYFLWNRNLNPAEHAGIGSDLRKTYGANLSRLHNIIDMRREVAHGWSLLEVLVFTREAQATDPRDKIYGLLGLTSQTGAEKHDKHPQLSKDVSVTYEKSVEVVYQDLAVLLVERSQDPHAIEFLYAAGRVSNLSKLKLPSWVPDWSVDQQNVLWWNAEDSGFQAAKDSTAKMYVNVDSKILSISGKEIDIVERLDSKKKRDTQSVTSGINFWIKQRELVMEREAMVQEHSTYGPEDAHEAFWRTIIANRDENFRAPPAELELKYRSYRSAMESIKLKGTVKHEHELGHWEFAKLTESAFRNRRFFMSSGGRIGLAPIDTEIGDWLCVFLGGQLPVVLRPDGDFFTYLGECYFHGFMSGEAMERDDLAVRDFALK